jgi:hypothetical protein
LTLQHRGGFTVTVVTSNTTPRHVEERTGHSRRSIGAWGTAARVLVGVLLVGSVAVGHLAAGFDPWAWVLGLVGFPLLLLGWQRWRTSRHPRRLQATGPLAYLVNIAVFAALYLTPSYAPALSVTSDAALLFYGTSMLIAAVRGYAGCEVLAISNWVLRRDDQIGCMVFWPVDAAESDAPSAVPNDPEGPTDRSAQAVRPRARYQR